MDVNAVEALIKGSLHASDARMGLADKRQEALEKAVESQTQLLQHLATQLEVGRSRVAPEAPRVPQQSPGRRHDAREPSPERKRDRSPGSARRSRKRDRSPERGNRGKVREN